jgi:Flp pilus assembly pilin Flp
MKNIVRKLIRDEKGAAMVLALILLLVGGLITASLLSHTGTGLNTGNVYKGKVSELYAADAGVEDALWQIQNEKLAGLFSGNYDQYDYSTPWEYGLNNHDYLGGVAEIVIVNDRSVNVTIENVWIPLGIPAPDADTARQIIEKGKLVITGSTSLAGTSQYTIKIRYDPCGGVPSVEALGIWLPPGFEYEGGCSLEDEAYYREPTVALHKGGYAVVWSFSPAVSLAEFADSFTFQYSGPEGQIPGAAMSWIDTTGDYCAWDADVRIYKITSTATDPDTGSQTTVEGYTSKVEMRKLDASISGDYHAIGATLMTATATSGEDRKYRNRLFKESSATIAEDDIPSNAIIQAAWLYWSGWIEGTMFPFSESCVADAKVNRVLFGTTENMTQITTDEWQVAQTSDAVRDSWSYSCFYDVTDIVANALDPDTRSGTFTLGHVLQGTGYNLYPSGTTSYPLATPAVKRSGSYPNQYQWTYAGWSVLIIYSSPETKGHQLYLFDEFHYVGLNTELTFPISGFLAPDDTTTGSHLTCFVGEGDDHYGRPERPDCIKVNGVALSDTINPWYNVFNSASNAIDDRVLKSGIDIDTFDMSRYIDPGDTSAEVILNNGEEIYNLVYIILSFRSEMTSGGIMGYLIR